MSAPPSEAQAERVLSDLSNDLMSPYCPGRTIASCPSGQARKLEDHILAEARAGKTRDEIEADLVARFGTEIVGYSPPPLVLYGSALVGVAGLVLLAWVGRRWLRRGVPGAAAHPGPGGDRVAPAPSGAERRRLEDALDELDEF